MTQHTSWFCPDCDCKLERGAAEKGFRLQCPSCGLDLEPFNDYYPRRPKPRIDESEVDLCDLMANRTIDQAYNVVADETDE
jgi:hypothetical protein